jgi:hypothetical protein
MRMHESFEPPGIPGKERIETKAEGKEITQAENPEPGDEEPRNYASEGEVVKALDEAFKSDPNLYEKLRFQALKWLKFVNPGKKHTPEDAGDIVRLVVKKVLSQQRKWYRVKTPNIVNLLLMVIPSEIRNRKKKKKDPIIITRFYNKEGELVEDNNPEIIRAYLREELINEDASEQVEEWIIQLQKHFESKDDIIAYCVLNELLEIDRSENKNDKEYIAKELGISEPDVKNAMRRIRRKINSIIQSNQ